MLRINRNVYKCIHSVWFILYSEIFSILSKTDVIVQIPLIAIKMLGLMCRPCAKNSLFIDSAQTQFQVKLGTIIMHRRLYAVWVCPFELLSHVINFSRI